MNELLKEAIAVLLLQKSKDPRLMRINVTAVKMTADLKRAVVLYSLLGGDEEKAAARKALDRASGFVRTAVGETLGLKYTPEIRFEFDRNLEYAQHMAELLNSLGRDKIGDEDHDR
jgi:ribosome-binding factor A